jgi:phospholipase/carboxylesterase
MSSDNPLHALPLTYSGPPLDGARAATILLHGRGHSPQWMLELAQRVDLKEMPFVAVPAANNTWYPASFLAPFEKNQPHLDWALERVESVVRELESKGVTRSQIALVGFSQGACLACEYLYRTRGKWGAVAALTGGLIGPPGVTWDVTQSNTEVTARVTAPMLMATSAIDEWVPLARVEESAKVFRGLGAELEFHVYPNREHLVSDEEVVLLRKLLARLL